MKARVPLGPVAGWLCGVRAVCQCYILKVNTWVDGEHGAKRPCPLVQGQGSPAEFWGSQTSRGSPRCISVSPPPSPHQALPSAAQTPSEAPASAMGTGAEGGRVPFSGSWPGSRVPMPRGRLGEQLSCPVRFLSRKSQQPVWSRLSSHGLACGVPRTTGGATGSWGALTSHCPGGTRLLAPPTPRHLRFLSRPKSLQEKAFQPKVTVSSISNRGSLHPRVASP